MKVRHSQVLVGAAIALLAAPLLAASPAAADSFDPYSIVESQGLLQSSTDELGAQARSASEAPAPQPSTSIAPVSITPLASGRGEAREGATVYEAGSYGVVTGKSTKGTNAGFLVLNDATAPSTYQFQIGSEGTNLKLNDDGTVTVLDDSGQFVNYFSAPWARDANGRELATNYTVEGNVITQHIDTAGAAFPVVADPSSECGIGWCSAYFNRAETKQIAAGGTIAATLISAACLAINPWAGLGCAIALGSVVGTAQGADATGDCVGLFFTPVGSNPFIEPRGTAHCY